MRSVEDHLARVLALLGPLPGEPVDADDIGAVLGRTLSSPVHARWSSPSAPSSSMDGYAVRAGDTPARLPVIGTVAAGAVPGVAVTAGTAVRIMTGALLPDGADTVVPVEGTDGGLEHVRVHEAPRHGDYVRAAGEDVCAGDLVLAAGTLLGPAQLAAAVAAGAARLIVARRPRVLVVSTGDELVPPGATPGPAQVVDSNGVGLAAAVVAYGGEPTRLAAVADQPETLLANLEAAVAAHQPDVVVSSGGVSVGAFDVIKAALLPLGVDFARVAMQPGMPQAVGRWRPDGPAFLGLPGNPVSALVSGQLFLAPLLRRALGRAEPRSPGLRVRVAEPLRSPPGKRQLTRVLLTAEDGGFSARPAGGAASHLLTALAGAHALLVVPEETTEVAAGDELTALPLPGWSP